MVLTLVKMNLELFANSAEHHVVWWPRLFRRGDGMRRRQKLDACARARAAAAKPGFVH